MVNDKNNTHVLYDSNVCSLDHFRISKINRSYLIMSISQQLTKTNTQYLITPQSLTEAMDYAKMIAVSSFCPKGMQGKPGDVLIAIQMGAEVGLSAMQALQNIAIINGRPCIWGDAALALVQSCTTYVSHREWEETTADGLVAYCGITRKGSDEYVKSFSEKDAKKASLWGKSGPWTQYPSRMLQMRARGFALRDKFADALKGISIREEVEDYQDFQEAPRPKVVPIKQTIEVRQIANEPEVEFNQEAYDQAVQKIKDCKTLAELKTVFTVAYKHPQIRCDLKAQNEVVKIYKEKKLELEREEFLNEYDAETGEVVAVSQEAQ